MSEPIKLQEQIELTTPVTGKKVVIRGYASGRIKQAISAIYLRGSSIETTATKDGEEQSKQVTNAIVGQEATNKAIELMVISVDGLTDNILDRILDLQEDDFDFVIAEVDKVQTPLVAKIASDSKKTTTTSSTKA